MDWKSAVIPTSTKSPAKASSVSAPPKPAASDGGQTSSKEQYVNFKIKKYFAFHLRFKRNQNIYEN